MARPTTSALRARHTRTEPVGSRPVDRPAIRPESTRVRSVFQLQQLGLSSDTSKTLLQIALVAGSLRLLVDAWNGRARLCLASALLILTPAWLVAWYGTWTVGLSAVDDDPAAELVALATTAYLLSGAIPLSLTL